MKKAKKVVALALCAVMLVVGSVAGTMAYLQDKDEVVNTFTVGNVAIVLDETDVDNSNTNVINEGRDQANKYNLIPGSTYVKDPIIHVSDDSQDCYLFVKVENGLQAIEATPTIAEQMSNKGWVLVDGTTDVYAHNTIAKAGADVTVFETFTIAGTVDNNTLEANKDKTIKVTAYAVQKENFNGAQHAWNATFGAPATN